MSTATEETTSEATENTSELTSGIETHEAPTIEVAKRRGRPAGSKTRTATPSEVKKESVGANPGRPKKAAAKKSEGVSGQHLCGIHAMLYMMTNQQFPELQLSEGEGQALANSINAVCEEYDLSIDGKTGAFLQFAGTAAMIYAPRVMSIRKRMAENAQQQQQQNTQPMPHMVNVPGDLNGAATH